MFARLAASPLVSTPAEFDDRGEGGSDVFHCRHACGHLAVTVRQRQIVVPTSGPGLYEVTEPARAFVRETRCEFGLLTLFVRHTSCSLLIQENADPDVRRDLEGYFQRLVPSASDPSLNWITHRIEGPDDMPAHIKAALTAVSISVPVEHGRLALGTWQGVYLFEHREQPHRREILLHLGT